MKNTSIFVLCNILLVGMILSFAACGSDGQWTTVEPQGSCTARHENGVAYNSEGIYLIGGRGVKAVENYNPTTNTWSSMDPPPVEMHHITPVTLGNRIYIVGGLTGVYPNEQPLEYIFLFDPIKRYWDPIFKIPEERRRGGAGVVAHEGKIYIVNGITNGHTSGTTNMFDVFDPKQSIWTQLADAPNIRDHSVAGLIDNKLVALGGRNTSYHEPDNFEAFCAKTIEPIDVYDFETQRWTTLDVKIPTPSAGAGSVVYNNELYYMGGETAAKEANNQVYSLDLNKERWTRRPSLNQGRHGTNAVVLNNKIYIAAGSANQGGGPELTSIEVYE